MAFFSTNVYYNGGKCILIYFQQKAPVSSYLHVMVNFLVKYFKMWQDQLANSTQRKDLTTHFKHYVQRYKFRHFERNMPAREAPITFMAHVWHKHGSSGRTDQLMNTVKHCREYQNTHAMFNNVLFPKTMLFTR